MHNNQTNNTINNLVEKITRTFAGDSGINFIDAVNLPVRDSVIHITELLTEVLFPGYTGKKNFTKTNMTFILGEILYEIQQLLTEQIERAYKHRCRLNKCNTGDCRTMAHNACQHLLSQIPNIREKLKGDVQAAYDGDPAADSLPEIVISYPGITAIATYRLAHELHIMHVPLIPRLMTEYAHSKTGIDIHPGAQIGQNFFIDHGTGVVIGETTIIGNNVKLYQGTTLGALSFSYDQRGKIIKGTKRHPTIEDNVTIYAEATILGNITIGKNSVIGSNTWVKNSVPPNTTVTSTPTELIYRQLKK